MTQNPTEWRELSALRRLADDVHTIVTRALPGERGPVWQRLSNAYDHYREAGTGGGPGATQQLGRIPFVEPAEPCGDPACRACWLPPGDSGPLAPGVDPDRWFADNPPQLCPNRGRWAERGISSGIAPGTDSGTIDLEVPGEPVPLERCTAPATVVVEAWSPKGAQVHGSLDESRYACADHVTAVTEAIQAAGMTAHRTSGQHPRPGRVCGEVFDYRDLGQSDPLPAYPFQGKQHGAVAINITPGEPATAICAGCAGRLEWRQREEPQPGQPLGGWLHVDLGLDPLVEQADPTHETGGEA